jgi:plastocyanin
MKIWIVLIILFLFVLTACSNENIPQESGALNVNMQNFAFSPSELKVKAGDTVTWTNNDNAPHTVTGEDFNSGTLNKGDVFSYTFTRAGTYEYVCNFHSAMKGKIIVE